MLQLGLMPSHLSFLFLQIIHARRFGLGTLELPLAGSGPAPGSARFSAPGSDTMMVSEGEFDDDDMVPCVAVAGVGQTVDRGRRKAVSEDVWQADSRVAGVCQWCI